MFSYEYCKILKNSFFYTTPLEAASVMSALSKNKPYVKQNKTQLEKQKLFINGSKLLNLHSNKKKIKKNRKIIKIVFLRKCRKLLNPNKACLLEGSFFWGGGCQFDAPPPSYFQKNLSNININLYNC